MTQRMGCWVKGGLIMYHRLFYVTRRFVDKHVVFFTVRVLLVYLPIASTAPGPTIQRPRYSSSSRCDGQMTTTTVNE